jgi:hypothetical protein
MPDGVVSTRDFVQTVDLSSNDMNISVTSGNTIVFDSFSPEAEVRKRNVRNNNVSKLNNIPLRFSTEFYVGVKAASVTAILCSSTVQDYKVVDKKTSAEITPTDKRPDHVKEKQQGVKRPRPVESPPSPLAMVVHPGVFGHPGLPRCDMFTEAPAKRLFSTAKEGLNALRLALAAEPRSTMNLSPAPITSPRDLSDSEEGSSAPEPFPFRSKDLVSEQQPIYRECEFFSPQHTSDSTRTVMTIADVLGTSIVSPQQTSDSMRIVMKIADVLGTPIEEIQKDVAKTLLDLPNSIDTSNGATLLHGMGSKSKSPPGKG